MESLHESTKENHLSVFVSSVRVLYRFVQKNVASRTTTLIGRESNANRKSSLLKSAIRENLIGLFSNAHLIIVKQKNRTAAVNMMFNCHDNVLLPISH